MSRRGNWKVRLGVMATLAVLLVVTISYTVPSGTAFAGYPSQGIYQLTTESDGQTQALQGDVYFEVADRHKGKAGPTVFKLHFLDPNNVKGHGFGFMIPLSSEGVTLTKEQYRVPESEIGFLDRYESVFGYADVAEDGGELFFTESGSISIQNASDREVTGDVDLILKDNGGHSMHLKGRFNARPLHIRPRG